MPLPVHYPGSDGRERQSQDHRAHWPQKRNGRRSARERSHPEIVHPDTVISSPAKSEGHEASRSLNRQSVDNTVIASMHGRGLDEGVLDIRRAHIVEERQGRRKGW